MKAVALLSLLFLAACSGAASSPAPLTNLGTRVDSSAGAVMVRDGDNVWQISKRYRLPLRDIIEINHLEPPYALSAGQRIILPKPLEYKVAPSDTLHLVSRMYAVPLSELVKTNNLSEPYRLQAGQVIRIPSPQVMRDDTVAIAAAQMTSPITAPITASPTYEKIEQDDLAPPPSVPPSVSSGAPVYVPAAAQTQTIDRVITTWAGDRGTSVTKQTATTTKPLATTSAAARPVLAAAPRQLAPPVTTLLGSARPNFGWPLRGKVVSGYGPKTGGLYNDGINIAAPKGTPVAAAADGVVAYVGDDLRSYGNLVLIRHSGGMTTAYAHLSSVSVRKGARIAKGQPIGTVGTSGTVSTSQLHFEVRKGSNTIDPKKFLG